MNTHDALGILQANMMCATPPSAFWYPAYACGGIFASVVRCLGTYTTRWLIFSKVLHMSIPFILPGKSIDDLSYYIKIVMLHFLNNSV